MERCESQRSSSTIDAQISTDIIIQDGFIRKYDVASFFNDDFPMGQRQGLMESVHGLGNLYVFHSMPCPGHQLTNLKLSQNLSLGK